MVWRRVPVPALLSLLAPSWNGHPMFLLQPDLGGICYQSHKMAAAEFTLKAQSLITLFMGPCLGLGREIFEQGSQKKNKRKEKKRKPPVCP